MHYKVRLFLAPGGELLGTEFSTPSGRTLRTVRGKESGACLGAGTFKWTAAVRGLLILFLRTTVSRLDPTCDPVLEGSRGSVAGSFDFALSKGPVWIVEMFGATATGELFAKRLFRRVNSNQKRPGPVRVTVNSTLLPPGAVEVFVGALPVTTPKELWALMAAVENRNVKGSLPVVNDCPHGA